MRSETAGRVIQIRKTFNMLTKEPSHLLYGVSKSSVEDNNETPYTGAFGDSSLDLFDNVICFNNSPYYSPVSAYCLRINLKIGYLTTLKICYELWSS